MILDYLCLFYYKAYVRKKVRRPWYFVDSLMEGTIFFTFAPFIKLGHILFVGSTSLIKVILLLLCLVICNIMCEKLEAQHRRNVQMLLNERGDIFPNVPLIICMLLSGIYIALMVLLTGLMYVYVYIPLGLEGALAF